MLVLVNIPPRLNRY